MSHPGPRFREIFLEVYEALPRQGPGSRGCAAETPDPQRRMPTPRGRLKR